MGSIYPHFEGARWDKLGYDSYDFAQCWAFCNVRKWRVRKGRQHTIAYASTLAQAKKIACEQRGWQESDVDCIHILHH